MSDQLHTESTSEERPNSGLREGAISHAEVNASLRRQEKTIVFGQQNRLRAGRLMTDDKLPRYHAGHDVVKFFYGAIRQLPESYVDALLHWGISVTMVKSPTYSFFTTAVPTSLSTLDIRVKPFICRRWCSKRPIIKAMITGRSARP